MSVAPPPATYTATNDLNALKNIFVPQYQFSNGYYHAIVNTQLPGNVAVGNTTTGFLLTVNGAPTMTLSDLQNWSYYRATSNLVMNSNSITTVSKLTFVGGNTTNAFTIDAPNGLINVSAYYLRGNFINLSGGLPAWAKYPASANVNMVGYSISATAFISLSLGGTVTNPASNIIGFSNAAFGETMRITQSGQVSIGTTAQFPGFSLVVNGSSQFKSTIVMTTSAYTANSNSFFVNAVPTSASNSDIQLGALGGNTNLFLCAGGTATQRLKLGSEGNFTVMTGTLTTTDTTLPHLIGGIIFQNQNISATGLKINGVTYTGGVAAGVATINSTLSGNVTFTAGTNISLYTSGNSIVIGVSGSTGGSSGGVTTINSTLSGNVTFTAGTNISLYSTGNNITITTNVSGTYGGVVLSGNTVTASALTTTGGLKSLIGGVVLQSGYISASGVVTSPSNLQNTVGGVTLQNNAVTVNNINICGGSVDSIVSTVNGYKSDITITGGTGIQVATTPQISATNVAIGTSPAPVTVINLVGSPITLPETGRGDIFIFPTNYRGAGSTVQVNFPLSPIGLPAGTSWRITNSSENSVDFLYNQSNATLPNLDPLNYGSFRLSPGSSILLVKIEQATNNYYNVN